MCSSDLFRSGGPLIKKQRNLEKIEINFFDSFGGIDLDKVVYFLRYYIAGTGHLIDDAETKKHMRNIADTFKSFELGQNHNLDNNNYLVVNDSRTSIRVHNKTKQHDGSQCGIYALWYGITRPNASYSQIENSDVNDNLMKLIRKDPMYFMQFEGDIPNGFVQNRPTLVNNNSNLEIL